MCCVLTQTTMLDYQGLSLMPHLYSWDMGPNIHKYTYVFIILL